MGGGRGNHGVDYEEEVDSRGKSDHQLGGGRDIKSASSTSWYYLRLSSWGRRSRRRRRKGFGTGGN